MNYKMDQPGEGLSVVQKSVGRSNFCSSASTDVTGTNTLMLLALTLRAKLTFVKRCSNPIDWHAKWYGHDNDDQKLYLAEMETEISI